MPQMFPLMWFSLFMSIFFTLLIMLTLTHFSTITPALKIVSDDKKMSSLIWKW